MGKSVRLVTLTSAISIALMGTVLQGTPEALAAAAEFSMAQAVSEVGNVSADNGDTKTYIVTFAEEGLIGYRGGVNRLAATAPDARAGSRKLDVHSAAAIAYETYLESQRAHYQFAIEQSIGRPLQIAHTYSITLNGFAAPMTSAEAAKVAQISGVKSVEAERIEHLDTYRGPTFIGANTIWNGTNTPSHVGTKGQGIVVGIIDGGTNSAHPSFANTSVDSCGFDGSHPKLIAKDCSTSSGGLCTGPNPEANPHYGHGVHTSSTVAGNTISNADTPSPLLPSGVTSMSGVAPCASIRQYKVCETDTCSGAAILAGIQNAISDQVDVINFSISGGTSPWSSGDNDRNFLDAVNADVFVAASAGNTSTTVTNPVGQVNHRGPWVMTVAASTQDQGISPQLSIVGPDAVPPSALQGIPLNPGSTTPWGAPPLAGAVIRTNPANIEGCTATGAFPANYFADGAIALVRRGTCNFFEKIDNAAAAGATLVIVGNNQAGTISMDTSAQLSAAKAFSIASQTTADALIAYVNAHLPPAPNADVIFADGFDSPIPPATANFSPSVLAPRQPDVLADFSFRGPTPGTLADLTKPDITAPGVDIFAALDVEDGNYGLMSGTSMSGPHVAGSAALIRAVHPDWTVAEVKSALMTTATGSAGTKENGTTPWDVDDVGSGRVDLSKAALAGLTMDETYANYLAANPSGGSINVKSLNTPSLRNMACNGTCTWTRKFKNRLSASGTWTITSATDSSFSVSASPASFTLAPGAEQTVTFTGTITTTSTTPKFGYIKLKEGSSASPDQVITIAVKGVAGGAPLISVTPASLSSTQAPNSTQTKTLAVANTGGGTLNWSVAANANGVIYNQPATGTNGVVSSYSSTQNGGLFGAVDFTVSGSTVVRKITAYGFDNSNTLAAQPTITWRLYGDAAGVPNGNPDAGTGTPIWTYAAAPTSTGVTITSTGQIDLDLNAIGQAQTLAAGTYWLTVTPTYNNDIGASTNPRWAWFYADSQGTGPAKLVGTLFGVANWTNLGTLVSGGGPDFAFKLEGDATCGAPWLSLSPTSGAVAGGASSNVTVSFNSTGMAAGTYNAMACIASNDSTTPIVKVPVTMTVDNSGGTCTPTQLFQDPGLEQTDTFWTGVDSVFGDPFCDASCDSSGVIGPHTGTFFAWIGGTATAGTGSLSQSVVFPSGQSRWLNFWMIDQLGTQATLNLTIDGTQVTTFPAGAPSQTYALKSFQIPALYLDGQSHAVKFNYTKTAGSSIQGVMLDDVTLDCSAAQASQVPASDAATASIRRSMH